MADERREGFEEMVERLARARYGGVDRTALKAARRILIAAGVEELLNERDALAEALGEDHTKWSFNTLLFIADVLLERVYPADVPLVCDRNSPDPGPRLAAAVRDCRAALSSPDRNTNREER